MIRFSTKVLKPQWSEGLSYKNCEASFLATLSRFCDGRCHGYSISSSWWHPVLFIQSSRGSRFLFFVSDSD
ncbi:MAG: hypothetical protein IPL31_08630 [Saprospiraceae bacterium]|nr:hypothetical protein [Saprospiraceae bacterium]